MFVGHFERDLFYGGEAGEHVLSHGIEGVLYGEALMGGESSQEVFADIFIEERGGGGNGVIDPGDVTLGGEDAIGRLFKSSVSVSDIVFEAGVGGLQNQQVTDTGGESEAEAVFCDRGSMFFRAAVDKGMGMWGAVDGHSLPAVF